MDVGGKGRVYIYKDFREKKIKILKKKKDFDEKIKILEKNKDFREK